MIPALARFVETLRREGIDVSPAEAVDATRAVQHTGPEDRERFRIALRLALVKRREGLATFDRVFDAFFAAPARGPGRPKGERSTSGAGARSGPRAGSGRASEKPPRPVPPSLRRSAPNAVRPARPASPPPSSSRPDTGHVASSSSRRIGRLRETALRPEGTPSSPSRSGGSVPAPEHRDVTRPLPSTEERALAEAIPGIIDQLRLRRSRRARRARRGRIWARRALRENLSRGGVPFVLPRRTAKPRRTRVVLLVDVSFSTARAAGYFLWMAAAFLALGRRTRVIAFVDRPVDVTRAVQGWIRGRIDPKAARGALPKRLPGEGIRPAGVGFDALLRSIPRIDLSAPSDYGRAFHALLRSRMRPAGRDTVLVVLGDARTNRFEPLAWSLEEITRRCRYAAWLVPEPRARWGTGDSALGEYLPFVDTIVEARDLSGLARGLDALLRRV
jgi:uncharacterized protein with von Willebrand factor type A (vWA) domain